MNEQIIVCKICGKRYPFFSMLVGDQSICPGCRSAQNRAIKQPDTEEQKKRRREAFGNG